MRSFTEPLGADFAGAVVGGAAGWTSATDLGLSGRAGAGSGFVSTSAIAAVLARTAGSGFDAGGVGGAGSGSAIVRVSATVVATRAHGPWSRTRNVRLTTSSSVAGYPATWLSQPFHTAGSAMR